MKSQVVLALFLGTALALAVPGLAQHPNENNTACVQGTANVNLVACLSDERKKSDASLDAVYAELRKRLSSPDAERLAAGQRQWLVYRHSKCTAARDPHQDEATRYPAYIACLDTMTRARTQELQTTYAAKLK